MSEVFEELEKTPEESLLFDMNFSNRLVSGETISAVTNSSFTNNGLVSGSTNITLGDAAYTGGIVQIRISGGQLYEQYTVMLSITTSLGNTRVGKGLLRIV